MIATPYSEEREFIRVTYKEVNLRAGPGLDYERVGILYEGETAQILERSGNEDNAWYKIALPDGNDGWIASWVVDTGLHNVEISGEVEWTPVVETFNGVPMVYVPAGCFMMGSTDEQVETVVEMCMSNGDDEDDCRRWYGDEQPQHQVCLSAFWISQTEVTNAQYKACEDDGACTPPNDRQYYDDPEYADHPVVYVDWYQSQDYAEWLGGSLPTEAQWEYAARGPAGYVYPWGNEFDGVRLNFCDQNCEYDWRNTDWDDGYAGTAPVGSYKSGLSWVGALDMSGNVWEWVLSEYREYPYVKDDDRNDKNTDNMRVLRGGAFYDYQRNARAADRFRYDPSSRFNDFGFRACAPISF